jgi:prepilin-type processing-associated H-X9-DG protein
MSGNGAGVYAAGDYALNAGSLHCNPWMPGDEDKQNGMFSPNVKLRLTDIPDGTSNTFALGEKYTNFETQAFANSTDGPTYRWGFHSCRITQSPMNGPPLGGMAAWGDPTATFGSNHPNGSQFGFADGSVRFVPQTISLLTYQWLSIRNDGNPVDVP